MHVFKRFYLILAIGASLLIPTLVFTEYVVVEPIAQTEIVPIPVSDGGNIGVPAALEKDVLDVEPILWAIYSLGFIFFGFRFLKNLLQIIRRVRKNPKQKSTSFIQVLLKENFPPHTFFKYIFLNRKKLEANEIPHEVLLHEETHARQKHSYDVIFIEFLQVIFWFNPIVFLFKKAIKLNHEFLADEAVLKKDIDQNTYQNTLLSYLSPDREKKYQSKLANAINYSSIKKRFTVMKTHTSKKGILFRTLLLLPLLAFLLLGFSETNLIEVNTPSNNELTTKASYQELVEYNELAKKYNAVAIEERKIPLSDLKVLESVFGKMSADQKANAQPFPECPKDDEFQDGVSKELFDEYNKIAIGHNLWSDFKLRPRESEIRRLTHIYQLMSQEQRNNAEIFPEYPSQDGASRELMKEYNALAKKYNTMLSKRKSIQIKKKDVDRLAHIYGLMSEKQKADAEPFPDFPPMPDPPAAPKAPKVKKGEKSDIPPPPPEPNLSDEEFAEKVINETIANQDPRDYPNKYIKGDNRVVALPPSPPEPQSPLDHVIEMAKKGATFYYEGRKVSSDKAIDLLKNNKNLNIDSRRYKGQHPQVRISKNPVIIEK